jgi:dihydroorotate dehydrogenase electron transfer subunit
MSSLQIFDVEARVLSVTKCQGNAYSAILEAKEIASCAKPMQFVNIMVRESRDPLLRRPFSLSDIEPSKGTIAVTWAVVGKGTELMTKWQSNQHIKVLGPLGNGIDSEFFHRAEKLILIAGGTGFAPLFLLAKTARQMNIDTTVLYGAKSLDLVMDSRPLQEMGCLVRIATEDGSLGTKGLVTDLLENEIDIASDKPEDTAGVVSVACGPLPMLAAVKSELSDTNIPLYVSLEQRMACGYGLCQGCVVKSTRPEEGYYRVCTDGPVFLASDVDLERE